MRTAIRTLVASTILSLALAESAAALEPVKPSELESLAGKKVYIEVPVKAELRKGRNVEERRYLVTGEAVVLRGAAIEKDPFSKNSWAVDGWCQVETTDGKVYWLMTKHLSKTKPAYSMLDTGDLETFLPKVCAAGVEIPGQLADLWKKHDYDFDKSDEARELRQAYDDAFSHHKWLVRQLVHGRESRSQALRDETRGWLASADPSVMDAFCEGMTYLDRWKKSEFMKRAEAARDLLSTASRQTEAAGEISRVKYELRQKGWLQGLRPDVSQAQKDALDREETGERVKRIEELEKRISEARERIAAERKEVGV